MQNKSGFQITLLLSVLIFLLCCHSKKKRKESYAGKIAAESCEEFSKLSQGIVGGIISGIVSLATDGDIQGMQTGEIGKLPEHWCDCYRYFVTKDLSEKFNEKELRVIYKDKIKKFMVIEKIIEKRQEDMKRCIDETGNKIMNDYDDFAGELEKRFRE